MIVRCYFSRDTVGPIFNVVGVGFMLLMDFGGKDTPGSKTSCEFVYFRLKFRLPQVKMDASRATLLDRFGI